VSKGASTRRHAHPAPPSDRTHICRYGRTNVMPFEGALSGQYVRVKVIVLGLPPTSWS
jgi:hypothetical protein